LVRLGDRLPRGLLEKCSRSTASTIEALSRLVDAWFAGASIPAVTSSFHYQKRNPWKKVAAYLAIREVSGYVQRTEGLKKKKKKKKKTNNSKKLVADPNNFNNPS
jgi:hypothetical protein